MSPPPAEVGSQASFSSGRPVIERIEREEGCRPRTGIVPWHLQRPLGECFPATGAGEEETDHPHALDDIGRCATPAHPGESFGRAHPIGALANHL